MLSENTPNLLGLLRSKNEDKDSQRVQTMRLELPRVAILFLSMSLLGCVSSEKMESAFKNIKIGDTQSKAEENFPRFVRFFSYDEDQFQPADENSRVLEKDDFVGIVDYRKHNRRERIVEGIAIRNLKIERRSETVGQLKEMGASRTLEECIPQMWLGMPKEQFFKLLGDECKLQRSIFDLPDRESILISGDGIVISAVFQKIRKQGIWGSPYLVSLAWGRSGNYRVRL